MFILPLGHEDFVVRRLPWVTIGIAVVCTVLQVRACAVEGGLEDEAAGIAREISKCELEIIAKFAEKTDKPKTLEEAIESFSRVGSRENTRVSWQRILKECRSGKLCDAGDPLLLRLRDLEQKLDGVLGQLPAMQLGYRPGVDGRIRMLTSAFAHGGWMHLIFNMWFLYLVGCNLEDRWGRGKFLAFYLAGAVAASLAFKIWHPDGQVPLIGASGAVAACMGAFMVCFASTNVRFFYFYMLFLTPRFGSFSARAGWVMVFWFVGEAVSSLLESATPGYTTVAYSAHVGGFITGSAIAGLWHLTGFDRQLQEEVEQKSVVFSENPLYGQAIELKNKGQAREAIRLLHELVEKEPLHQAALEELFLLSLELEDDKSLAQSSAGLIGSYTMEKNFSQVANAYRRMIEYAPAFVPDDKTLIQIIRAAREVDDLEIVLEAVETMEEQYPRSELIPRALWDAALAQQKQGWSNEARATLKEIAERYPMDPFAEQARRRLTALDS